MTPTRLCAVPHCSNLTTSSRCSAHRLKQLHGRDGSTRRWRKLRARVLRRDGHQCTHVDEHGNRCPVTTGVEVDHVIPLAHGGADHLANLRTLCPQHHAERHAQAARRPRGATPSAGRSGHGPSVPGARLEIGVDA